jgi:hypothetical protein
VKDQYFGDARDYFKYHLLEEMMRNVPGLQRLVCLWMLTTPDDSGEGNVPFVVSPELPELSAFLRQRLQLGDRRVRHMREYFRERDVEYVPWGDEPPYFTGDNRAAYFGSIPDGVLHRALVFFDPDIGLSSGRLTPKHLSFDDLGSVYNRLEHHSIALVYQHRWRRADFWEWMAFELKRRLGGPLGYIADPSVAFYVAPKATGQIEAINEVLERVANAARLRSLSAVRL